MQENRRRGCLMDKRIGFIGLGIMGKPMGRNLLKAGYPLTVYSRGRGAVEALTADGAAAARSSQEVAERSDVVITMVTDTPDVRQVILADKGALAGMRAGGVIIDMSTISPAATREIAEAVKARGVRFLDAPVSGGEGGAIAGTLSIMVGGEAEVFGDCLPIFQALGKNIIHVGGTGTGQLTKLCNQIAVAVTNLAMGEALVFAAKSGVNLEKMHQAISGGAAGSWQLTNLAPRIFRRDFAPGFMVRLQQKDLRLVLQEADRLRLALPATSLVHSLFNALETRGAGDEGTQALVKVLEQLAGVEVKA
ncbi:MAG TPA: NAD(P)-binding domain-containing protein [Candidatus Binatia bacterium]|nr:NAD(P)-binding domain-containing protein [Candidatus Binatia bacterium]